MAFVSNDTMELLWKQKMQCLSGYRKLYEYRRDLRRQWSLLRFDYTGLMQASGLKIGGDSPHLAPPASCS